MKFRKAASIITAGVMLTASLSLAAVGCTKGDELANKMFGYGEDYYKSVSSRHTMNYDEMVYDDFTEGINPERWVISDSVWDQWSTDQNGVRPQNVFLVNDEANPETHLLLRANGSYYNMENDPLYTEEEKAQYSNNGTTLFTSAQGYGVNSGASISTVEAFGPGRYDIKMKACPRVGALTSMWVYSWFTLDDGSTQQNEIDIEVGLKPDFSKVYYTTWISPSNNTNYGYESYEEHNMFVNDGDWHVYSFDWVTDVDVPYVDYYIDGVFTYRSDSNVPTTNATLTIGVWCPSWAGGGTILTDENGIYSPNSRMFESDYAEISWWRYVPFQMSGWEQRAVQNRNYVDGYIPKTLTSLPVAEKCSNGNFERDDYGSYGNPWADSTLTPDYGNAATIIKEDDGNSCAKITNGGFLGQWLRGASSGFKYKVSLKYRTEGDATAALFFAYVLGYSSQAGTNGVKIVELGQSAEWKTTEFEFMVDMANINSIHYYLYNSTANEDREGGSCYFDDITITYLGYDAAVTYPN